MWNNFLGHDEQSEISTLIARMREKRHKVTSFDMDSGLVNFDLTLRFSRTVPVPNTTYNTKKYEIRRENLEVGYAYYIKQVGGYAERLVSMVDGYIIWALLEFSYFFKEDDEQYKCENLIKCVSENLSKRT